MVEKVKGKRMCVNVGCGGGKDIRSKKLIDEWNYLGAGQGAAYMVYA